MALSCIASSRWTFLICRIGFSSVNLLLANRLMFQLPESPRALTASEPGYQYTTRTSIALGRHFVFVSNSQHGRMSMVAVSITWHPSRVLIYQSFLFTCMHIHFTSISLCCIVLKKQCVYS